MNPGTQRNGGRRWGGSPGEHRGCRRELEWPAPPSHPPQFENVVVQIISWCTVAGIPSSKLPWLLGLLDRLYLISLPLPPGAQVYEDVHALEGPQFRFLFRRHVASLLGWTYRRSEGSFDGFPDSINDALRVSGLRFTLERDSIDFESEGISCGLRAVFDSLPNLNDIVQDMQSPGRGAPSEMVDEFSFGDFAPLEVQSILNKVIGRPSDTLKRAYEGKGKQVADLGQSSGTSGELPEIQMSPQIFQLQMLSFSPSPQPSQAKKLATSTSHTIQLPRRGNDVQISQPIRSVGRGRGRGRGQRRSVVLPQSASPELVAPDAKQFTPSITRSTQRKEFTSRVLVRNLFGGPLGDVVATDAASGVRSEVVEEVSNPHGMIDLCQVSRFSLSQGSAECSKAYSDSLAFHSIHDSICREQVQPLPQYIHRRVKVKILDLVWGGEYIQNPCQYAHGFVLGLVDDPAVWINVGEPAFLIDFGSELGTQVVRFSVLEQCCSLPGEIPPLPGHIEECAENLDPGLENKALEGSVLECEESNKSEDEDDSSSTSEETEVGPAAVEGSVTDLEATPTQQTTSDNARWDLLGDLDGEGDSDWSADLGDSGNEDDGLSEGEFPGRGDSSLDLLAELGQYPLGPPDPLAQERFDNKYQDRNWHAKSWSLDREGVFCGPVLGPSVELGYDLLEPVEYFFKFWDTNIQEKIVVESNNYSHYIDPITKRRKGGPKVLDPISLQEHRQFLGICCLMGVRQQPSLRDYWRRYPLALHCANIASTMSRVRFEYILRCTHLVNKEAYVTEKNAPGWDPVGKIRWLLDALTKNYQRLWNPSPFLTVDECMISYNGRFCNFKQYLPLKPISHCIKMWALADSVTKVILKLEMYVGKEGEQQLGVPTHPLGAGGGVVTRMTQGYEHKWYTITVDNYFTSVQLFENLLSRGIYAVGTARYIRRGFLVSLKGDKRGEKMGTLYVRMHRDRRIVAVHWTDIKPVCSLSIVADLVEVGGVNTVRKQRSKKTAIPTSPMQLLYSCHMHGVDVSDQLRATYSTAIATKKWYMRIYFFLLDTTITNAYQMYRERCGAHGVNPMDHGEFQLSLAYGLMAVPLPAAQRRNVPPPPAPPRRIRRALVGAVQVVAHCPHRSGTRRMCVICRVRTYWICRRCNGEPLCPGACFDSFHP